MKTIAVCVLLIAVSSAFTFDSTLFLDGFLQGSAGWAFPKYATACLDKAQAMGMAYYNFWKTFSNFDSDTIASSGSAMVSQWAMAPRCYFTTNVPATVIQGLSFTAILSSTYQTLLYPFTFLAAYAYYVVIVFGSVIFDLWVMVEDVMAVYNGNYNSTTIGYIGAFFVRWYAIGTFEWLSRNLHIFYHSPLSS